MLINLKSFLAMNLQEIGINYKVLKWNQIEKLLSMNLQLCSSRKNLICLKTTIQSIRSTVKSVLEEVIVTRDSKNTLNLIEKS